MTAHLSPDTTASLSWTRSPYSSGGGNNCVEVAAITAANALAVRDSKSPHIGAFAVPSAAWTALLSEISGT